MLLDDIKLALRISHSSMDNEINDLIETARHDLMLSGVSSTLVEKEGTELDPLDPLIKRAITVYVKANFGFDNPDADRLQNSYNMLKQHLSLAGDYREVETL